MEGQIKRKRLDIVDFLRGFSIFTIVLMHLVQCYPLPGFLMKASSMGGAGVMCLFYAAVLVCICRHYIIL